MMRHLANMRPASNALGDDGTLTRWIKLPGRHQSQRSVTPVPASAIGTRFPSRVMGAGRDPLVSGHSNVKIGRDVRKGHLRGYWIYTLSLEERATCPTTCVHWTDCYGNSMPFAKRVRHGPELEAAIEAQIERLLAVRGRRGILIRLHALGDFYSVEYVHFWGRMLVKFPTLALFGYTARHPVKDEIGAAVCRLILRWGPRARIRASDLGGERNCTVSIKTPEDCPPDAFVCPEQTGKTTCCATCGACWGTTKNVAFLGH